MLKVRVLGAEVAKCLQEMHDKNVMHGDVKHRNFVMVGIEEASTAVTRPVAAIDLDAAAKIDGNELAGAKPTSSGCLPPEQAAIVLHRRRRVAAIFTHLVAAAKGDL